MSRAFDSPSSLQKLARVFGPLMQEMSASERASERIDFAGKGKKKMRPTDRVGELFPRWQMDVEMTCGNFRGQTKGTDRSDAAAFF